MPAGATFPTAVLVVDDEQSVIDVLSAILRKSKLEAKSAMSGEDAVKLLEKERFGCLITDKNLPGMNGLDLIKEARRLQPYCASLIMTGYPTAQSMLEAMRAGASDYLEKPFPELGLVVQRITQAMEHSRVAFEREALARTLREMRARLKKSEEAVFQRQTELDVFVQVLELRVEEATATLQVEKAQAQSQLLDAEERLQALQKKVAAAAEALKAQATRAGLTSKRPTLTLPDARDTLENLERSLSETADELAR